MEGKEEAEKEDDKREKEKARERQKEVGKKRRLVDRDVRNLTFNFRKKRSCWGEEKKEKTFTEEKTNKQKLGNVSRSSKLHQMLQIS